MKLKTLVYAIAAICLILGVLSAPVSADTVYTSVYAGTVSNGQTVSAGGCFVNFAITNGSVHVTVTSPDYSEGEAYIPAGNAYYYLNVLRVYVAGISGTTATVDIGKTTSSTSGTGIKIYCDTPAQNTLAGDDVTFPITIQNYETADETLSLSTKMMPTDWSASYDYNGKDIYQIYVPASSTRTVNFIVSTPYTSSIGQKTLYAKIGDTTLTLYVDITSVNESVAVTAKQNSQIGYVGSSTFYELDLENPQAAENDYRLSVTGLPDNWYYMYLDSQSSSTELAETIVPASSTKALYLKIVPPYTVTEGDYNFTAVITTPENQTITKDLTLKLKSTSAMTVNVDKLAYDASPGKSFTMNVYVTNTGSGTALTNVYPEISAPSGWTVSASPTSVSTIKSGETQTFVITVDPPGNIVASDYDVTAKIISDQASSSSEEFRITITTSSYIPYIAGGIIVVIGAGLFFLYRKYGRR